MSEPSCGVCGHYSHGDCWEAGLIWGAAIVGMFEAIRARYARCEHTGGFCVRCADEYWAKR